LTKFLHGILAFERKSLIAQREEGEKSAWQSVNLGKKADHTAAAEMTEILVIPHHVHFWLQLVFPRDIDVDYR
jgi:hypothetical protein